MPTTDPAYLRPLDAALDYLARGWSVLPVGQDKRPLLTSWKELQERRATELEIADWRAKWPEAGVGIIAGEISGLLIIDLDAKDPTSFAAAKARVSGCLPESLVLPMARTRSGGEHWFFKRPEGGMGNRAHVEGLPIDVRCDGGYVVAAPTPGYTWLVNPSECELPEAPAALLELLAKPRPATPPPAHHVNRDPGFDFNLERACRYVANIPGAVTGQGGHDQTYRVANVVHWEWALDDSDAWDILLDYNARCDPPWSEKELRHKLEEAKKATDHQNPYGYLRDARRSPPPPVEDADVGPEGEIETPPDPGAPPVAEKPSILVDTNQQRVVREAIAALARQRRYFQRGTSLYRVVQPAAPAGEPRSLAMLDLVPPPSLRIAMSASAHWYKQVFTKKGELKDVDTTPPDWAVNGVHSAGQFQGIPPLVAITSTPCIRRDGTVLNTPGYDESTGLIYRPIGSLDPIKDKPTRMDALAARDQLLEVVRDFPFAGEEYKAAWISLLLTPFARYAISDSAPLGYIDANTRGSGKSLLAQVTALIATGRQIPMSSWPDEEDEREKRITTFVMEGSPIVIFDNCEASIGGQCMNIILTSNTWKGRILGLSRSTGVLPLRTFFMATGNNAEFAADTPRRTIHVRLQSPLERPEQRTGFDHPYLLAWVADQRGRLAAAALTILRAYTVAGMPIMGLPAMGGFTDWSRLVRGAVVWVDMIDPVITQDALTATADRSTAELAAMLEAIKSAQIGTTDWFTSQELLRLAEMPVGHDFKDVLLEYLPGRGGELPTARVLGVKLRRHVDRVNSGLVLRRSNGKYTRWRVLEAPVVEPI